VQQLQLPPLIERREDIFFFAAGRRTFARFTGFFFVAMRIPSSSLVLHQ